jgi:Ca-activated chloride channel family protein
VIAPAAAATAAAKESAYAALEALYPDGGTHIQAGLLEAAAQIETAPAEGALARIVMIGDGEPSEGLKLPSQIAEVAAGIAAKGISITTVGVGLIFDEHVMTQVAVAGRGNYYFAEDTALLADLFRRELDSIGATTATSVQVGLIAAPGVEIVEAYGYPLRTDGAMTTIPIADLRAGETRKVVLRVSVDAAKGKAQIASLQLGWRRVIDGTQRRANATVRAEVVDDAGVVAASSDPAAIEAVEQALSARALEEATLVYETQGADAARQVLQRRVEAVRANKYLAPKAGAAIETIMDGANAGFAAPPSAEGGVRTRKQNRASAYELAR